MRVALTREISPAIDRCELTHLRRTPIDIAAARVQHQIYEDRLRDAGCAVRRLPADSDMPDSVFIEDVAVVFDEVAVITRPGAASRRLETAGVAEALQPHRRLVYVEPPGTIDGGDVLTIGRRVFVGESSRTNAAGVRQLEAALGPFGYSVSAVRVTGCLHLKSAATVVGLDTLLVNREWLAIAPFDALRLLDVDGAEPGGANALSVGDAVIYPSAYPATRRRLESAGLRVLAVDVGELAKAEGGVTCCSLVFESHAAS